MKEKNQDNLEFKINTKRELVLKPLLFLLWDEIAFRKRQVEEEIKMPILFHLNCFLATEFKTLLHSYEKIFWHELENRPSLKPAKLSIHLKPIEQNLTGLKAASLQNEQFNLRKDSNHEVSYPKT